MDNSNVEKLEKMFGIKPDIDTDELRSELTAPKGSYPKVATFIPTEQNTSLFLQVDNQNKEVLKLCQNGDIFVKGRLAENDKEVVDALREFLRGQGLL